MNINRPSKHQYYIGIAAAVSARSTCLRRHYGCVIVKNDEIIATGYNGNPRGTENCIESGQCSKYDKSHNSSPDSYNVCRSVHAEQNAMLSARRVDMIGATLYLAGYDVQEHRWLSDPYPCPICIRMMQNAGIASIVNCSSRYEVGAY